jgi:hypothetical protein
MTQIEEIDTISNAGPAMSTADASTPTIVPTIAPIINAPTEIQEIRPNKYSGLSLMKEGLDEKNWTTWTKRITSVFKVCQVYDYIQGTITQPAMQINPKNAKIWASNDEFAKHVILINLTPDQLNHVNQEQTAAQIWHALVTLHQVTGMRTALTYMRTLFTMRAKDDDDIPQYINNMKTVIEQINTMDTVFKIDDMMHTAALAQSLPASWDHFINNIFHVDRVGEPMQSISIVLFERLIKNEYCR